MLLPISIVAVALVGCVNLKTRSEVRGETSDSELQRQTARQQRDQAKEFKEPKPVAAVARTEELDEQMRQLNGRMDVLENQLNQMNAMQAGEKQSVTEMAKFTDQKFQAYEEALKKMETQVAALNAEIPETRFGVFRM